MGFMQAGLNANNIVFPVMVLEEDPQAPPVRLCGSSFLFPGHLLVTCWHNVEHELSPGQRYAVGRRTGDAQGVRYLPIELDLLARDENGTDLATARMMFAPPERLDLFSDVVQAGTTVWSCGFPLSRMERTPTGERQFELTLRYLQGYVIRLFNKKHFVYGRIRSYELDMPAPAGLSGAPLFFERTNQVIGVIYGTSDAYEIEQFRRVDPVTEEVEPEVQRLIYFGAAHRIETLRACRGPATDGKPLAIYLGEL